MIAGNEISALYHKNNILGGGRYNFLLDRISFA